MTTLEERLNELDEFDVRLAKTEELLKDKNVAQDAKERTYDEFIHDYPYYDTSKLDNLF